MKKILFSSFAFFTFCVSFGQVPVIYYDFEDNSNRLTFENAVEQAVTTGNSSITRVSLVGATLAQVSGAGMATYYAGSSNGRGFTSATWSKSAMDPGAMATEYLQCNVNTSGFSGLSLSFDIDKTSGHSPSKVGVLWSANGMMFYPATTAPQVIGGGWNNIRFVLPAGAENQTSLFIRIYAYDAGSQSSAGLNFDNLTLSATGITGVKTLLDYDAYGLSLTSGKTHNPKFNGSFTITGSGTVVTLNTRLNINNTITVGSGATLSFGASASLSSNSLDLENGSIVQLRSVDNSSAIRATLGTSLFRLNPLAIVEFIGTSTQYQDGTDLSNVVVNNPGGVVISGDIIVNGNLTLKNGIMKPGANKLTLKGNITRNGGAIDVTNTEIIFNGIAAQSVPSGAFTGKMKKLTVNNAAGVNFDTDASISEAITLTSGKLSIGTKKLTISGSIARNGTTELGSINAENAAIELDGTLAQSVPSGTFQNNKVKSLRISNTNANGVSLNGSTEVTDVVDFGLVSNSKLKTNNNLVLKSNAGGTARIGDLSNGGANSGNTIEGDVSVERFTPAWGSRRYRLMTSPVMNTTINEAWQEGARWNGVGTQPAGFGTLITGQQQGTASTANNNGFDYWSAIANGNASVKVYVPGTDGRSGNWQSITSTTAPNAFDNHQAYLVFIRGDRSVFSGTGAGAATVRAKGKLKTGTVTINVPASQGHTLIGNPYASPLDFKQVYDANSTKIQPYFWVYQASLGTGTGGFVLVRPVMPGSSLYETIPGDGSQKTENRLIHSGEGFFVMPNPSASGTNAITIQEKFKSNGTPSVNVFRQEQPIETSKLYINITTSLNGVKTLVDGVMAQFGEGRLGGDVVKSANATENISIVKSASDLIVASNTLPGIQDTMKLRFWNAVAKEYQLEIRGVNFATAGVQPVLVDSYLKKESLISVNEEVTIYPFTVTNDAASKNQNRFFITYKMVSVLPLITIHSTVALENNSSAHLCWSVSDEKGVTAYTIEKSSDNINFIPVITLDAMTASGEPVYNYIDSHISDVHYYRVKLTGTMGDTKYSTIMRVEVDKRPASVNVFPNPVKGTSINLQLVNKPAGMYTVTVHGMAGQVYASKTMQHTGGSTLEKITLPNSIPSGNYKLELRDVAGAREIITVSILK